MSNNSVFNTVVCVMGILILVIHSFNVISKKDKRKDEIVLLDFFVFTIFHFATYLTYTLIKANYTSNAFVMAFYTSFYIMNNLEVFLLFRYAVSYIDIEAKTKKRLSVLNYCTLSAFVMLDIINIFTGIFFTVSDGQYLRSKTMIVSQGYQFAFFAIVFLVCMANKKLSRLEKSAFGLYCFLPLVAIVLQNIYKGYAIAYASIIIAIEILFSLLNIQKSIALSEKVTILDSMAGIYDNVNLIDFVNSTETNLRTSNQRSNIIDMNSQSYTLMNQRLKNSVSPEHLDAFLEFTNIKTVRKRLANRKIISGEFFDSIKGWFRAQYIAVDSTPDGIPNIVIYTTRNIDEEKQREEHLIRISMTDEMTRLFNRRCYDVDLNSIKEEKLADDLVLYSIDVNGLKMINDTKGHAAGDELIKGAANCISLSFKNCGKVYRTGGDEFMAIIHTDNPEEYRKEILSKADSWRGVFSDELSVSVGYAAYKDNVGVSIDELEQLADKDMYTEKEKYYAESGVKSRKTKS